MPRRSIESASGVGLVVGFAVAITTLPVCLVEVKSEDTSLSVVFKPSAGRFTLKQKLLVCAQ